VGFENRIDDRATQGTSSGDLSTLGGTAPPLSQAIGQEAVVFGSFFGTGQPLTHGTTETIRFRH